MSWASAVTENLQEKNAQCTSHMEAQDPSSPFMKALSLWQDIAGTWIQAFSLLPVLSLLLFLMSEWWRNAEDRPLVEVQKHTVN